MPGCVPLGSAWVSMLWWGEEESETAFFNLEQVENRLGLEPTHVLSSERSTSQRYGVTGDSSLVYVVVSRSSASEHGVPGMM